METTIMGYIGIIRLYWGLIGIMEKHGSSSIIMGYIVYSRVIVEKEGREMKEGPCMLLQVLHSNLQSMGYAAS